MRTEKSCYLGDLLLQARRACYLGANAGGTVQVQYNRRGGDPLVSTKVGLNDVAMLCIGIINSMPTVIKECRLALFELGSIKGVYRWVKAVIIYK